MPAGMIMALDLATRTGFAIGKPGATPRSGVTRLKDAEDEPERAARNLGCWLRDQFIVERPDLVVYEAPLNSAASLAAGNSHGTPDFAWRLVGAVHAVTGCYGIRSVAGNVQTVRKHFLGAGRPENPKRAVVARCHALGLMSRASRDDNQADAIALWSWAEGVYGQRGPADFVLTTAAQRDRATA